MMPKIPDVLIKGSEQLHLFDTPILLTREYALNIEQRIAKRVIDVICALILIVLASPFMLITAVVIKLYDGGPVLYKQIRCTRDAKEFQILKFRSMRVDAEKDGVARLSTGGKDDRITPVGKVIRKITFRRASSALQHSARRYEHRRPAPGTPGDSGAVRKGNAGVCTEAAGKGGTDRIRAGVRQIQYDAV